jgi:hypothetical protein
MGEEGNAVSSPVSRLKRPFAEDQLDCGHQVGNLDERRGFIGLGQSLGCAGQYQDAAAAKSE